MRDRGARYEACSTMVTDCLALQDAALGRDPGRVLEIGCQRWAMSQGLARAWAVQLIGEDTLAGAAAFGLPAEKVLGLRCPLAAAPATLEALRRGSPLFYPGPGEWTPLTEQPLILAPLTSPEGSLGVLVAEWQDPKKHPTEGQLGFAGLVAEQVASSCAAAQRLAAADEAVRVLEAQVRHLETQAVGGQRHRRLTDEASHLLRRATRRLHTVIDQMPQGLAIAALPDGVLVLANPVARRFLGVDREGHPTHRILKSDGSPYPSGGSPMDRALRGEACQPEEVVVEAPGKRGISLLMSAAPLVDARGQPEEVVLVLQDVTPMKEVERLKSEIISLVSHELRTPLHHVKGFASTLLSTDLVLDDETRQDLLQSIDQESDRLIALVTDLLDMGKLEAGAAERSKKVMTDPGEVLRTVHRRFENVASGHRLDLRLARGLRAVPMDRGRIERVLINLVQNALHFSPAGGPITLAAETGNGALIVRIADHGRGVSPADRDRVFERFYRGLGAVGGGAGLGLSICKAIVEAHGGRIWVEDTPGGGATFVFSLPASGHP